MKANSYNTKPPRVVALDAFRGLLMVLQSLDRMYINYLNNTSIISYTIIK
jgi:hypothetical protein